MLPLGDPVSVRVVVRTISELCITVGTLIVLFVVYVLFWTGVKADSEMDRQIDQLQEQWSKGGVRQPAGSPARSTGPGESGSPAPAPEPPAPYAYD